MAVGAIGWMTSVRIDLDFAFSRLSQHLQNPTTSAWNMLHRTMGYIKSHQHLCLSQSNTSEPEWKFFTDSDHGSDKTNLKPQLGILATCGGTPIIFKSKKSKVCFPHSKVQTAHSDISVGASEVYALGSGTSDFMGLSYVVEELGLPEISKPMNIRVDNTAAEAFANGTAKRTKMTHIDQRLEFVQAMRDEEVVNVTHISTHNNLADFLTKALSPSIFRKLRDQLMCTPPQRITDKLSTF